jgi:hypothetical protein
MAEIRKLILERDEVIKEMRRAETVLAVLARAPWCAKLRDVNKRLGL